eukprot:CAMPEP_0172736550 /NCGR_PEP_ID=MMETSP1074-20121228/115370_1 /TAXON_ID=2916 /ORGANISM="Ceratium fusus, Strain PA161109" /LENGTH=36 /DNA_ID= /DNA_START= /DNA_END= /DNA_ORIENTATION=
MRPRLMVQRSYSANKPWVPSARMMSRVRRRPEVARA